jgi:hypothetical protein
MASKGKTIEILELHAGSIQSHAEHTSANHTPNHDEISRRAYEIYLERGGLSVRELDDWLQAESEFGRAPLSIRTRKDAHQET